MTGMIIQQINECIVICWLKKQKPSYQRLITQQQILIFTLQSKNHQFEKNSTTKNMAGRWFMTHSNRKFVHVKPRIKIICDINRHGNQQSQPSKNWMDFFVWQLDKVWPNDWQMCDVKLMILASEHVQSLPCESSYDPTRAKNVFVSRFDKQQQSPSHDFNGYPHSWCVCVDLVWWMGLLFCLFPPNDFWKSQQQHQVKRVQTEHGQVVQGSTNCFIHNQKQKQKQACETPFFHRSFSTRRQTNKQIHKPTTPLDTQSMDPTLWRVFALLQFIGASTLVTHASCIDIDHKRLFPIAANHATWAAIMHGSPSRIMSMQSRDEIGRGDHG